MPMSGHSSRLSHLCRMRSEEVSDRLQKCCRYPRSILGMCSSTKGKLRAPVLMAELGHKFPGDSREKCHICGSHQPELLSRGIVLPFSASFILSRVIQRSSHIKPEVLKEKGITVALAPMSCHGLSSRAFVWSEGV